MAPDSPFALTEDEELEIFERYQQELTPRRRRLYRLSVCEGRAHNDIVRDFPELASTVGASRTELSRTRNDLVRLAVAHGDVDSILIRRLFTTLPVPIASDDDWPFEN